MNVFDAIGHFFVRFGKKLGSTLMFIRKHVSDQILEQAIDKALELGENKLLNNETRRNQLVDFLQNHFGLSENIARWTTETAVANIKNKIESGEASVDKWIDEHRPLDRITQALPPTGASAQPLPPNPAAAPLPTAPIPAEGVVVTSTQAPTGELAGVGTVTTPGPTTPGNSTPKTS
jgi:hypothetical protein